MEIFNNIYNICFLYQYLFVTIFQSQDMKQDSQADLLENWEIVF